MAEKKSEIRLYPSFTEVRENVKVTSPYVIYLPQDLHNQIISGSLSLEGVKVQSMVSVLKESNLEGKILYLNKNDKTIEVKVIRGRDLLVQNVETKRYFHAGREQFEYNEIPEEMGTEVTFQVDKEGDAVLSYLMNGINWSPRYTFNIAGDQHEFRGWADINNNTQRGYTVSKTELLGGDVSIQNSHRQYRAEAMVMMCRSAAMDAAPRIQSEGEKSGLYMYSIADEFFLAPRSTYSLPFANPVITLEKVALTRNYFSETRGKAKFSRVYRIKSSEFLPAGSVTVREDSRVVGQAHIPNLSADESYDLVVGDDPDVSYTRETKSLEVNKDNTKFEVTIKIFNNKNRDVNFEYKEDIGYRHEIISNPQNLTHEFNTLTHNNKLEAKQTVELQYTVLVHYN